MNVDDPTLTDLSLGFYLNVLVMFLMMLRLWRRGQQMSTSGGNLSFYKYPSDILMIIAYLLTIGHTIVASPEIRPCSDGIELSDSDIERLLLSKSPRDLLASGPQYPTNPPLLTQSPQYTLANGAIKLSTTSFFTEKIYKLHPMRSNAISSWRSAVCWTIAFAMLHASPCQPLQKAWKTDIEGMCISTAYVRISRMLLSLKLDLNTVFVAATFMWSIRTDPLEASIIVTSGLIVPALDIYLQFMIKTWMDRPVQDTSYEALTWPIIDLFMRIIFANAPFVYTVYQGQVTVEKEATSIDKEFAAFVAFKDTLLKPTVSELLGYDDKPWEGFARIKSLERSPSWIWFHLPAVNQKWLTTLGWQLQFEKIIQTWDGDSILFEGTETVGEGEAQGIPPFLINALDGDKIVDFPRFDNAQGSRAATFSVAMRFLDSEDEASYNRPENKVARLRSSVNRSGMKLIPSKTLDESFYVTNHNVTSASRDQARDQVVHRHYERYRAGGLAGDETQSTFSQSRRYIKPRILMVSPLRLWKIGHNVVITASPANWEISREFDLTALGHVYQSVTRSHPRTANAMELVSRIMASLITVIDGPLHAGLNESILTIFEDETSAQNTKQLELYKKFRRLVTENTPPPPNTDLQPTTSPAEAPTEGTNQPSMAKTLFRDEVECFRVVMDIRDELAMISSIILEQERAMQTVTRTVETLSDRDANATMDQLETESDPPDIDTNESDEAPHDSQGIMEYIESESDEVMLGIRSGSQGFPTSTSGLKWLKKRQLGYLLSVRLQVSNLAEAEDTKRLLESSKAIQKSSEALLISNNKLLEKMNSLQQGSQAIQDGSRTLLRSNNQLLNSIDSLQKTNKKLKDKADKQSRYLFAFTVVTVIFAPLSFVTSFFAIPSRDFPQDGGISWSQSQIGGGLAISLLLTIVLVLLTIMANDYTDASDVENGSTPSGTSGDGNIVGFTRV
ncbi:hypothetical protein CEP54_005580 [Fusarium duplospermum]|uniref:Rhodopsin domain-containing protein n=1 Tax=Fusarium duplospermum TaxID=1325734 RepID=A0A428QBD8_9HYPO|nr:hypothetical protein CEP54_005580 [Fusarium duplospermum]